MPINTTLHRLSRAGLASDAGKGSSGMESWEWGMSPSPVWNNLSISSPGAWDDPRWKGKLLLEHHPRRSQLYRALSHCHKQGQCCPPPHTSSMSMSSGAPSRKQPSRLYFFHCIHSQKLFPCCLSVQNVVYQRSMSVSHTDWLALPLSGSNILRQSSSNHSQDS